jgi:hypothetical protein
MRGGADLDILASVELAGARAARTSRRETTVVEGMGMRRPAAAGLPVLIAALLLAPIADAGLISKEYHFKPDVTLEIGAATDSGLRLDSVRFHLPSTAGGEHVRTGGVVKVEVAVSNTTGAAQKVGIAVALFDEVNRLVGVASGGSKVMSIKGNRQKSYTLVFDDVNGEAYKATTFQISIESKR